jgi:hypothetical protein
MSMAKAWVERGALRDNKGGSISVSCRHRKAGACGGCYARMYLALKGIEAGAKEAKAVAESVFAAMRAEGAKP